MAAQEAKTFRQCSVIRGDHASVTEPAQVLRWVKAKASQIPNRASSIAMQFSADGLRRIFDHENTTRAGDFHNGGHVRHLTIEVNWNYRACARRDFCRNASGIDIVGSTVNIHEDRYRI